jgi:hypothetical protein
VSDQELPEEVAHDLSRYLDGAKPARVAFYDKKLSRVEAWFQTTKLTPGRADKSLAKVPHEELLGLVHPSGGIVIDENRLHTLALRTRRLLEDYVALRQEEFGHTEPARLENCCGLAAWLICRQLWAHCRH